MIIEKGQRLPLADNEFSSTFAVKLNFSFQNMTIDYSCFGVDGSEKLSDDKYMIFFNQKNAPNDAIILSHLDEKSATFSLNLNKLPETIEKLIFTAAIDGNGTMNQINSFSADIGTNLNFTMKGADFSAEKAIMILEIYKKSGIWRIAANGQGFNGGLSALLAYFGGEEAKDAGQQQSNQVPTNSGANAVNLNTNSKINLDKRIEKEAPHLVSLTKKAQITLDKRGLSTHKAKCALCLDISASMDDLYRKGLVQELADRVMALATRFDDDGELDVFLFGEQGHQPEPMKIEGCSQYIRTLLRKYDLEGGTRYHTAMKLIREHYFGNSDKRDKPVKFNEPVYVMFITDGGTSNRESAINQVMWSSYEPLFWQFMAVGNADFGFLEKLDDLSGRFIDNADFFNVSDLSKISDEQLFDKMMTGYPGWVKLAQQKGLF